MRRIRGCNNNEEKKKRDVMMAIILIAICHENEILTINKKVWFCENQHFCSLCILFHIAQSTCSLCYFTDYININLRPLVVSAKKIHISEATHLALENGGDYTTEFRGEMPIKVRKCGCIVTWMGVSGREGDRKTARRTDGWTFIIRGWEIHEYLQLT